MSKIYHLHTGKRVATIAEICSELNCTQSEALGYIESGIIGVHDVVSTLKCISNMLNGIISRMDEEDSIFNKIIDRFNSVLTEIDREDVNTTIATNALNDIENKFEIISDMMELISSKISDTAVKISQA